MSAPGPDLCPCCCCFSKPLASWLSHGYSWKLPSLGAALFQIEAVPMLKVKEEGKLELRRKGEVAVLPAFICPAPAQELTVQPLLGIGTGKALLLCELIQLMSCTSLTLNLNNYFVLPPAPINIDLPIKKNVNILYTIMLLLNH